MLIASKVIIITRKIDKIKPKDDPIVFYFLNCKNTGIEKKSNYLTIFNQEFILFKNLIKDLEGIIK